jgi:organic radical activating enzyme
MKQNNQPIEKFSSSDGSELDVHSIFFTTQGEGPFTGHRAVFIRLAGCNLKCPQCDTDYTTGRSFRSVANIIAEVKEKSKNEKILVVITGGEPFRQQITPLVSVLRSEGYVVQIESNGTLPPPSIKLKLWLSQHSVHLVISPKTGKIHTETEEVATALKYVVTEGCVNFVDGLPIRALGHPASPQLARPSRIIPIYIQPADQQDEGLNRANMKTALKSSQQHGHILQLQIHKIVGVE